MVKNKSLEEYVGGLYKTIQDPELSFDSRLQAMLKSGLEYLNLDIGIISQVDKKDYIVKYVEMEGDAIKQGDIFDIEGTYCVTAYNSLKTECWHNTGETEMVTHPTYVNFKLEAYIAAPLYINNQLFGTVNFTSPKVRKNPFSESDKVLVRLITEMVGNEMTREIHLKQLQNSEESLNKAVEELTDTNSQLENFTHTASHDMQAPLETIATYGRLVLDECQDTINWKAKGYLELMMKSCDSLKELINDLLEYSRVSDHAKFYEVSFEEIVRCVQEELQQTIKENKAKIHCSANLPKIKCNPMQLTRLLKNLIANGIKYQKNDNTPEIHININESEDSWLFSVKDNGIGLKEEHVSKIFQPFKRLHSTETYSGTGIGLAICKKIIDNVNGKIWVESKLGHGSTFHFSIPKHLESNDNDTVASQVVI